MFPTDMSKSQIVLAVVVVAITFGAIFARPLFGF